MRQRQKRKRRGRRGGNGRELRARVERGEESVPRIRQKKRLSDKRGEMAEKGKRNEKIHQSWGENASKNPMHESLGSKRYKKVLKPNNRKQHI